MDSNELGRSLMSNARQQQLVLMVRVLLIQQLFNLSDEQMEFQLLDRLSFQRFVGLRHSSQIPDRTTIWTQLGVFAHFRPRICAHHQSIAQATFIAGTFQHAQHDGLGELRFFIARQFNQDARRARFTQCCADA